MYLEQEAAFLSAKYKKAHGKKKKKSKRHSKKTENLIITQKYNIN